MVKLFEQKQIKSVGTIYDVSSLGNIEKLFPEKGGTDPPYLVLFHGPPGALKSLTCHTILWKFILGNIHEGKKKIFGTYITLEEDKPSHLRNVGKALGFKLEHEAIKGHIEILDLSELILHAFLSERGEELKEKEPQKLSAFEEALKNNDFERALMLAKVEKKPNKILEEFDQKTKKEPEKVSYFDLIVKAIENRREKYGDNFKMVVIDSLHAMEAHMPESKDVDRMRDKLVVLFKLLRSYNMYGLFILERRKDAAIPYKAAMEDYLVDCVIALDKMEFRGDEYFTIKVEKSRAQEKKGTKYIIDPKEFKDGIKIGAKAYELETTGGKK